MAATPPVLQKSDIVNTTAPLRNTRQHIEQMLRDTVTGPDSRTSSHLPATVRLHHVRKQFHERRVLNGIDLDMRAGEFVAIVGRSGCGKSTLLRIVAGLEGADHDPRTTVHIDGRAPGEDRRAIRIMYQEARLLPWKSVLDNVTLGLPRERRGHAKRALQQVGLADRADDWPAPLSGGQKQRVALARALAHQPRLLLLDEPLGALDALTRIEMQSLIESIWQQDRFTALLVTHDMTEAVALADRVIVLGEGRITLELEVALPRPRARDSQEFTALAGHLLRHVLHVPTKTSDAPVSTLR